MNPDPNYNLRNFPTSNLSAAALWREHEERLAVEKTPLVDLRSIPREQWPEYYGRHVTIPADIQKYLDGREPGPMTKEEVQNMEIAVERYHGVTEPCYVSMGPNLQTEGKAWSYVAEAAPYLSGFEFNITED
jgi:hypothetical protein